MLFCLGAGECAALPLLQLRVFRHNIPPSKALTQVACGPLQLPLVGYNFLPSAAQMQMVPVLLLLCSGYACGRKLMRGRLHPTIPRVHPTRAGAVAAGLAAAAPALAKAAAQPWVVGPLLLALAVLAVGAGLQQVRARFYFTDYIHALRD